MTKELLDSFSKLFERDLLKLEQEIASYTEGALWKTAGEITNPAGNLCLHLCGNLQHYVGHVLGGIEYIRDREREFAARDIPASELISEIGKTRRAVSETLKKLQPETLMSLYPTKVFDYEMTTLYFLIHLHGHLNYHLGQINYHRRLVS